MKTAKFVQINRSVLEGTLPLQNYSGLKPGDRVRERYGDWDEGTVTDVRFINGPSMALYYVFWKTDEGHERSCYPNQLRKI